MLTNSTDLIYHPIIRVVYIVFVIEATFLLSLHQLTNGLQLYNDYVHSYAINLLFSFPVTLVGLISLSSAEGNCKSCAMQLI